MTDGRTDPRTLSSSDLVRSSIEAALACSPGTDEEAQAAVRERASQVLRPAGALHRLDELVIWLAGWQRRANPIVESPQCLIFAADHGVAARGVSAYPAHVTAAMLAAVKAGIATSSALAAANGVELQIIDVGVGEPTADFTDADALSPERFLASWQAGTEAVRNLKQCDLLIVGELGIGNSTSAAAVAAGVLGGTGQDWVGRGTGVDNAGLVRKASAVDQGLARVRKEAASSSAGANPTEVMRCLGGAELVAMAAAVVEARRRSLPMILDGFIATAALLPLVQLEPSVLDHCTAGHRSAEQAHARILEALGKEPILQLDMRLGEGTGALVAVSVLRAAVAAVVDVATFAEAGVPGPG